MIRLKKKSVVLVTAGLVLVGSGAAFAYWSANGSGSGSATAASSNGSATLHVSFASGLTPGASTPVTYTGDNGGSSSLRVATITPTVSIDPTHVAAGCLASDFTATTVSSNTTLAAGASGVALGTGSLSFADTAVNQDSCKGATITISAASN